MKWLKRVGIFLFALIGVYWLFVAVIQYQQQAYLERYAALKVKYQPFIVDAVYPQNKRDRHRQIKDEIQKTIKKM